ncbi:MAG TPA: response regulator transcription factor [Gemmatimonadaceae bacterium]|nr:response regulator transcription factor [Gemmatimonadaceae bacterium]
MTYILLIDDNAALARSGVRGRGEVASQTPFAVSGNLALIPEQSPPPEPVILYLVLPDQDGDPENGTGLVNRVDRSGALRPLQQDHSGASPQHRLAEQQELGVPGLLARVEALLREATKTTRAGDGARDRECFGDVEVNLDARSVVRRGEPVDLAPVEFDLLAVLLQHRGHVVSRRQLVREVWHDRVAITSRTLDKHIYKLRRKLESNPANPRYLRTVTGAGYRLEP